LSEIKASGWTSTTFLLSSLLQDVSREVASEESSVTEEALKVKV
jgi:hypothetical protein